LWGGKKGMAAAYIRIIGSGFSEIYNLSMTPVFYFYTPEWKDAPLGLPNYTNAMDAPPYTLHTGEQKAIAIHTQHYTTAIATTGTQMLLTQVLNVSATVLSA